MKEVQQAELVVFIQNTLINIMQIELNDFQDGKPIKITTSNEIGKEVKSLRAQKKYDEILKLTENMPNSKEKYLIEANALLNAKKWKQLVKTCERGLDFEDNSDLYNLKGKAEGKLGNFEQKIISTKKAIELKSKVPAYHRNLGAAYYKLHQYEQALNSHQDAINLQPQNSINYHNKGIALYRMKELEEAKQALKQAVKKDPKQARSHGWLGDCHRDLKEYEDAKKCYEQAYELTKDSLYKEQINKVDQILCPNGKGIKGFISKIFK